MKHENMSAQYSSRLRDESRLIGSCDSFSVPASVEQLQNTAKDMWTKGIPVTVQGALTGICGCAVPRGGHILSTEKLNRILGHKTLGERTFVTLEPGVPLCELLSYCARNSDELLGRTFLPDPTEKTATLGGMFACNAKGPNSKLHGDTAGAVVRLKLLLSNGSLIEIRRGDCVFDARGCEVPELGRLEIAGLRNNGGGVGPAFVHEGSDLVDVLGGSEGMLGIVTELELELQKPSPEIWGIMFFFPDKRQALAFAETAEASFQTKSSSEVFLAVAEYLDETAIGLVNEYKKGVTALKATPDFPPHAKSAIYLELEGVSPKAVEAALSDLLECFANFGGSETDTWAGSGADEIESFRLLRHAVPEAVNSELDKLRQGDERICKLCTDFEVPALGMGETERRYSAALEKSALRGVVFGHLLSRRLHFNLLPRSFAEYEKGRELIAELARDLAARYDCVTWENGIGKTKKDVFNILAGTNRSAAVTIKNFFDGKGLLNPSNML